MDPNEAGAMINAVEACTNPQAERVIAHSYSAVEQGHIDALNRSLMAAYGPEGTTEKHKPALRLYLQVMAVLGRRHKWFGITNHRIFRNGDCLVVPFDAQ